MIIYLLLITMQIFIKVAGNKTIVLNFELDTTIKYIKDIVEHDLKIPQILFNLVFEGKQLDDNKTFSQYNIKNESTIYVNVLRLFSNKSLDKTLRDILIYQKNETLNYLVYTPELHHYIDFVVQNIPHNKLYKAGYYSTYPEPFSYAVIRGYESIVNSFINSGFPLNTRDRQYSTPLINATSNEKNLNIVNSLINAGANLNSENTNNYTALINASIFNCINIVNSLINAGANLDIQNKKGQTALIIASKHGYYNIVNSLINAGARLDITDIYGNSALFYASKCGHTDIVVLFVLKHKA
jgi:hypothetical protein